MDEATIARVAAWWRCRVLLWLRSYQSGSPHVREEAALQLAALGVDEKLAEQVITWPLAQVIDSKLWLREARSE